MAGQTRSQALDAANRNAEVAELRFDGNLFHGELAGDQRPVHQVQFYGVWVRLNNRFRNRWYLRRSLGLSVILVGGRLLGWRFVELRPFFNFERLSKQLRHGRQGVGKCNCDAACASAADASSTNRAMLRIEFACHGIPKIV